MTRSTFLIALAAAAATVGTIAFPAYAQEVTTSTEVRYADLNLADGAGKAQLHARIKHAANLVCGVPGQLSLSEYSAARKCARKAVAKAQPQIDLALARVGTDYAANGRLVVAAN
ncbi:UrcA family protein [Rhizorhabdus dicambivorans]|uniref:UrcA family protein n=1 Tax=Rhizorhabdus dicambivorans TaxID=1850238 RepID=A0A2A4FR80_9SPHN|nr:UrcA family protein [Rhizorhabdus dicambivorans]ATE63996.1 UrcA family protein [Rhizorhabdus dicambivorans]PCE40196.1 UrcA family protein [Rhizorhabdus dicambivorans]